MGNIANVKSSTNEINEKGSDEGTDVDNLYYCCYTQISDDVSKVYNVKDEQIVEKTIKTSTRTNSDYQQRKEQQESSRDQNNFTIFVGNISYRITQRVLWDFFNSFGTVTKTCIVKDHIKYHRRSKGFGFVTFSSQEEVRQVLKLSEEDLTLDNRVMRVFPADRKKREIQNIHADQEQPDIEENEDNIVEHSSIHCHVQEQAEGIHLLPNDVLLYIFSFVGLKDKVQLERVCKRWQSVVLQTWQSLEKLDTKGVFGGFTDKMLTDDILRILLKKGCWNLKELDLSSSPYLLTDWSVELIGQRCKKLVKLDLTSVKVTKSSLKFLASSCNQLKWIRLKNCNGFGEKGLWWLFHHCKLLLYVDVSTNYRISGQCFYMLSESLINLVLEDCRSISEEGLNHLVKKCPKLEYLDLSGCASITSNSIKHLSWELNHLRHLILKGGYHKIGQGSLTFSGLTSLEELVATHNSALTDDVILNVCKDNTRLRCLNVEGSVCAVTDIGLKAIVTYCKNLKELNIGYINQVSTNGLESLCLLNNLKELGMKGCQQLSDKALTSIVSSCLDLEVIDITGCINITEVSIKVLVDIHSAENTLKTCKCLTLNIGGTGVNEDFIKTVKLIHSNIDISTTSTILERYAQQDDGGIILGGMYTDDEDDIANDDEELEASNYGDCKVDWQDNDDDDDYHGISHGYHEDFLDAEDPFLEYEEWDIS